MIQSLRSVKVRGISSKCNENGPLPQEASLPAISVFIRSGQLLFYICQICFAFHVLGSAPNTGHASARAVESFMNLWFWGRYM
jgi:hypothetical protein